MKDYWPSERKEFCCCHRCVRSNLCPQVVLASLGVVSDIARIAERDIQPYVEGLMNTFWTMLQSTEMKRTCVALIISTMGDIAMAMEELFVPILAPVMQIFFDAAATQPQEGVLFVVASHDLVSSSSLSLAIVTCSRTTTTSTM